MPRLLLPLLAAAPMLALVPGAAPAKINIRVGIADQQVAMFDNPAFQRAKIKRVRYVLPWNVMDNRDQRLRAREYVKRARQDKIVVFLHFGTDDYRLKRAKRPSVRNYDRKMNRAVRYFRNLGVREFGAWNEANHASQPTYNSPNHAALYFRELYRAVKGRCRSCIAIGLDVLDQPGVERYMKRFYRRLSKTYRKRVSVVGIHNYGDVNRKRTRYTRAMIQTAHRYNKRADFWYTETGGIVKFGRSFPYSPYRAKLRLSTMFSLAKRYRRSGVERIYVYQWTGSDRSARFDAGLTHPDGSVRPGYTYLRQKLPDYLR